MLNIPRKVQRDQMPREMEICARAVALSCTRERIGVSGQMKKSIAYALAFAAVVAQKVEDLG